MDKLNLTNEEIFHKIEKTLELAVVHVKTEDNLTPCLFEFETKKLYEMPGDYMEYDAKKYWRKAA
jgi:hypothetical protein